MIQATLTHKKDLFKGNKKAILDRFLTSKNIKKFFDEFSGETDNLITSLCDEMINPISVSLLAVGGYGRKELFPYSDVDILVLTNDEINKSDKEKIEKFITALWDIGLEIGVSVRTNSECISEAKKDVTVCTNLIEARRLWGNEENILKLKKDIYKSNSKKKFLDLKSKERVNRYEKYFNEDSNLEPHIKEGLGAIRDLNTVTWITNFLNLGKNYKELHENKFLDKDEYKDFLEVTKFMYTLRCTLHIIANRREDRLLFDFQEDLANKLGYKKTKTKRASENLMHNYYRITKKIQLLTDISLLKITQREKSITKENSKVINEHFYSFNNILYCKSSYLRNFSFNKVFKLFELWRNNNFITGLSIQLMLKIWQFTKSSSSLDILTKQNKKIFLNFFESNTNLTKTLHRLNRFGILGKYLPAFGKIVGQMQHDLFHVFTVDEHTLKVIENIRRFDKKKYQHEFPECSRIIKSIPSKKLLYLSALFHDIAKGRGGDHSILGCKDVEDFGISHDLSQKDTQIIKWLVLNHLLMSQTAQKKDLSDNFEIYSFCLKCEMNVEKIKLLYLLTVADINGTNKKIWNNWKANLLLELYKKSLDFLSTNQSEKKTHNIEKIKKNVTNKLSLYGYETKSILEFLNNNFSDEYFGKFNIRDLVWQIRTIYGQNLKKKQLIKFKLGNLDEGITILVHLPERKDLFHDICCFLNNENYPIYQADIYTTKTNYALDIIKVSSQTALSISAKFFEHMEKKFLDFLNSNNKDKIREKTNPSRQLKSFPINYTVEIISHNLPDHYYIVISGADKPGILIKLTKVLSNNKLNIISAKINTLGDRVEDSILVRTKKLKDQVKKNEIIKTIVQCLEDLN